MTTLVTRKEKKVAKLLSKIVVMCHHINQTTKHHSFFNLSGHVDSFTCTVHKGGWCADDDGGDRLAGSGLSTTAANLERTINLLKEYVPNA